jgi:hypothetical protein
MFNHARILLGFNCCKIQFQNMFGYKFYSKG